MELKIAAAGTASKSADFWTSFRGRSPDTIPSGFFALMIRFCTEKTERCGAKEESGVLRKVVICFGKEDI